MFFESAAVRHVVRDATHPVGARVRIAEHAPRARQPVFAAVGPAHTVFGAVRFVVPQPFTHGVAHPFAVFREDELEKFCSGCRSFLGIQAKQRTVAVVPEQRVGFGVPFPHAEMRRFERQPQTLFGFAQRNFRRFPFADVEQNSVQHRNIETFRPDDHAFVAEPDDAAILRHHPVFRKKCRARLVQALLFCQDHFAILGMHVLQPQRWIGEPLLGRVAEIFLDLRADVVPLGV